MSVKYKSQHPFHSLSSFRRFLDHRFAVFCRKCKTKVFDPDKNGSQKYLNGKCPNCGEDSYPANSFMGSHFQTPFRFD
jgi:hypothetical protein